MPLRTKNSYIAAVPYEGEEDGVVVAGEMDWGS